LDKNRIKGTLKIFEGAVKEVIGKATGDTALEIQGKAKKAEGSVQKAVGKAKDAATGN
jgi:uncharacterized protein YjbJ (UPF0337 family)